MIARNLLSAAILIVFGLLGSSSAQAQNVTGLMFACHEAEDMLNFGILLDNDAGDEAIGSAATSLLIDGKCVYFPNPVPAVTGEKISTASLKNHEVWSAILPGGSTWYFLHKLEGKPS